MTVLFLKLLISLSIGTLLWLINMLFVFPGSPLLKLKRYKEMSYDDILDMFYYRGLIFGLICALILFWALVRFPELLLV
jgi:hypothetical protein